MEFVDEASMKSAVSRFLWNDYANTCKSINKEYEYYAAYTCTFLQRARYDLGQLLSAANTEHNWGEWRVAVWPDMTHDGLEIRTCVDCGAQSSRVMLYEGGLLGDVNADHIVNISDVTALINVILGTGINQAISPYSDVNEDGMITVLDVAALINIILSSN